MIPKANITAWGNTVAWITPNQVEQDLIISRALVEIFADAFLQKELRFRGGTALNKLHFPGPMRYSEDIDLVRTTAGPIGPILSRLRDILHPWLGQSKYKRSPIAPKLLFKVVAEGDRSEIRLKLEINTRERTAYDPPQSIPHKVVNPWFSGEADIATFSREEMLATKLRAFLQRDKGRDLFDLVHALQVFSGLDIGRVIKIFGFYLENAGMKIPRNKAEQRVFEKLGSNTVLGDISPLLPIQQAEALTDTTILGWFRLVFTEIIEKLPGQPWAKTSAAKEALGWVD